MIDINILKDLSEIINYDSDMLPYSFQERKLSDYTDMRALAHWHKDLECIYVFDGEMKYDINGKRILLRENDFLVVNSKQVHFGFSNNRKECSFFVLLFHPDIFQCNAGLYDKYVRSITDNKSIGYLLISDSDEIKLCMDNIKKIKENKKACEGYTMIAALYNLWSALYDNMKDNITEFEDNYSELSMQKKMLRFIYDNYKEQVSLDDIASAANICRSKCCRIFSKYLDQSPMDYLNSYRLEMSRSLLKETSYSITEIALLCGYNYTSYFSRIFLKRYNQSPSDYRRKVSKT